MQRLAYALIAGSAAVMVIFFFLAVRSDRDTDQWTKYRAATITATILLMASLTFSLLV